VRIFWGYLWFRALLWVLSVTGRLLLGAAVLVVLAVAAPVTLVAAVGVAGAWLRGWPPARLWRAAFWALPMTAVYLAGRAMQSGTWQALALAPAHDYLAAWHAVAADRVTAAFVLAAPVAVPAGLAAAGGLWAWRTNTLETGLSGRTAAAPIIFDARQWNRQARTARARAAAPGTVPLIDGGGRVVMGATIRAVGHRWRPVLAVPHTAMGRHQVSAPPERATPATAGRPGLQGRPRRPRQSRPHPPPAARRRHGPGGHLARRDSRVTVGTAAA